MRESLVCLHNATIGYDGRGILSGLNLTLERGEFCFLLGENGIGKSTLIRTISGHVPLIQGSLHLSPILEDRRSIGFVPQECSLNPSLPTTVYEFISLGLTWSSLPRRSHREQIEKFITAAGLENKRHESYWNLSGGQRRRALLARALIRQPLLLLLDEPTEGLDVEARESFLTMMREINEARAMTILFCTHVIDIARRFGTHYLLCHRRGVDKKASDTYSPEPLYLQ